VAKGKLERIFGEAYAQKVSREEKTKDYNKVVLEIKTLKLGPYRTNCYVVSNERGEAFVIDPGAEPEKVLAELSKIHDLKLKYILLTHAHFDHVGALGEIYEAYPKVPIYLHEDDMKLFSVLPKQGVFVGAIVHRVRAKLEAISDGEYIPFVEDNIKVIHTPGHSGGGVCFLIQDILFSGDTLFYHTIGKTDLPQSDDESMRQSLNRLQSLDTKTLVLPGHGRDSTISEELKSNPYLIMN
jgi:glyoxylase-like metal-dependent hydrolase (beta-lactamase superfamily II)